MALKESRKRPIHKLHSRNRTTSAPRDLDLKDARLLLHPSDEAYEFANRTIQRIMEKPPQSGISTIDKVLFLLSCSLSVKALTGYATLDQRHIKDIATLTKTIKEYVSDASHKRPLNFLMLASPGSGKSHFIKCVAQNLQSSNVVALTYDLTALEKNDDLIPSLEAARNQKVADKIPLLFLDEFDSRPGNIPMLLPLLWNGEINLGRHDLKLGKIVIMLSGSDPKLPSAMTKAKSMDRVLTFDTGTSEKIVDLLSRINGGTIIIPPFLDRAGKIDRRADKVCAAVHLLGQRFGKELRKAPIGLLRFIYETEFRYGVRSISHLVDLVPYQEKAEKLKCSETDLPLQSTKALSESSLSYHLIEENKDADAIVSSWKKVHSDEAWLPLPIESDELPSWIGSNPVVELDFIKQIYKDVGDSV